MNIVMNWVITRAIAIQAILLALSLLTGMGCQQNFQSRGVQSGANGVGADILSLDSQANDVDEVQKVADETEEAVKEASLALSGLINSQGDLTLSQEISAKTTQVAAQAKTSSLLSGLTQALDKVVSLIDQAVTRWDEVYKKLEDQKTKLDPSNPAHLVLIAEIDQLLARLQVVEAKMDALIGQLIQRVDDITGKLDQYKARLDPLNPVHLVGLMLVEQVKLSITDFRQKLEQIMLR